MSQQHQLAVILFTDIVGYTALMQEDEQKAVALIKHYHTALDNTVIAHEGKVLNYYGDGSLCTFSSVTEAVNCAIDLQKELQSAPLVPLRIGLHVGEIFFEDGKALGDSVNVASRIQSLGEANTILFSKEVFDKIKNHPELKAVSLGQFDFKNVEEPVEVFALANEGLVVPKKEQMSGKLKEIQKGASRKKIMLVIGVPGLLLLFGLFVYTRFNNHPLIADKDKTIAILPFKNNSINKEENEPFCVGVTLELQKKLEWLGGLIPIASQSVEKYRDTKMSITDISHELGDIKYIVMGTVQRDKNKVKVFASLVDAISGKQLWNDDFPGEVEDIFSLQENIAQQIASALQVKITPDEQSRISRVATKNAAAIDAYNDALTSYVKLASTVHPLYWDSFATGSQLYAEYQKTLSFCDKAINIDPLMAEAYVLKGQTYFYSIDGWSTQKSQRDKILDSAAFFAYKALEIDKSSADAYVLLSKRFSWYQLRDYEIKDSTIIYLKKALAINDNNFDVNRQLGSYYQWRDPEKAIRFSKKAIRLNPLSVWVPYVYSNLAFTYHAFGDFEKAESNSKKAVALSNNSFITIEVARVVVINYLHWGKGDSAIKYAGQYVHTEPNFYYEMAEAYCNLKNDCAEAVQLYKKLWERYNHGNQHRWAVALINIGKTKEANEKIQLAIKEYKERNDTLSYDYAGICALNGDKAKAIEILRKFDWPWGSPFLIRHDKLFDNIRNDKEFKDIVQKALDEKARLREKIRKMEERGEL